MPRFFGTPDGVEIGQLFSDRRELHAKNVHRPIQGGISGTKAEGADSICISGGYVDDEDYGDYIIYTGHGGRSPGGRGQDQDQSFDAPGNAGLRTSEVLGLPVRVVRGADRNNPFAPNVGYRYDGLYLVTQSWSETGRDGYLVVRYRLERIDEQQPLEPAPLIVPDPAYSTTTVTRRIRDSAMSRELKSLYDFECQVCGIAVPGDDGRAYAEGAHVRPLGRPHLGQDTKTNLLCLCPNHHTQLDIGGMFVTDDFIAVEAANGNAIAEVRWRKSHRVSVDNFQYHRLMWARAAS